VCWWRRRASQQQRRRPHAAHTCTLPCWRSCCAPHATPRHATPRHATPRHATPHHATPRHATPHTTRAVFAYPGGASMEIHQALTRSETIENILCRHEQVRARGSQRCLAGARHMSARARMAWQRAPCAIGGRCCQGQRATRPHPPLTPHTHTHTHTNSRASPCARAPQGEIFAAEGYAKTTGKVGVCIATSGPGATNLVTGLADAMMDSVPLVAITGQVRRHAPVFACVCVCVRVRVRVCVRVGWRGCVHTGLLLCAWLAGCSSVLHVRMRMHTHVRRDRAPTCLRPSPPKKTTPPPPPPRTRWHHRRCRASSSARTASRRRPLWRSRARSPSTTTW
jgi:hypothetical protein